MKDRNHDGRHQFDEENRNQFPVGVPVSTCQPFFPSKAWLAGLPRMKLLCKPLLVVAVGFVLLGCGDPKLTPIKSALEDPAGNFQLFVSNQSFATTPVDIRVSIDGVPVIQKYFDVDNQHNWQKYVLKLTPGKHRILATSRKGKATLDQTFVVEGKQSGVLDYLYSPEGNRDTPRQFSFKVEKGTFHWE